jgi:hypothetical protein
MKFVKTLAVLLIGSFVGGGLSVYASALPQAEPNATLDLSLSSPTAHGGPATSMSVTFLSETSIAVGLCQRSSDSVCELSVIRWENGVLRVIARTHRFGPSQMEIHPSTGRILTTPIGKLPATLYSEDLSVGQELAPLHRVSQSGATVAEPNRGGWKLYRLASRLEPLREGTGELQAVSERVVVIRDGDLLRTETLEGRPVASFSLRPARKCYSSVALVGDSLYVSDCRGARIVDFSGREQLHVRPPAGWGLIPTSSDNGKRLLFHYFDRKISAVRSVGEDVLAIATLGLGAPDEQDNREEIQVVDTTNGNSCFDWKRSGDLSGNAASISSSGEFVAIGSAGRLSVYRLPAVCETKTTK